MYLHRLQEAVFDSQSHLHGVNIYTSCYITCVISVRVLANVYGFVSLSSLLSFVEGQHMYVLARKFRPITISKQFTSCFLGENECGKISKHTNGQHKHFIQRNSRLTRSIKHNQITWYLYVFYLPIYIMVRYQYSFKYDRDSH